MLLEDSCNSLHHSQGEQRPARVSGCHNVKRRGLLVGGHTIKEIVTFKVDTGQR